MTTRRARQKQEEEVFWRAYEKQVADLLTEVDPSASVQHNQMVPGWISGVPRQVDVLVDGSIAGQSVRVVVEAKCRGRRLTIEAVDGFVGRLLDLGAERGIIYSAADFSDGAILRASRQRNPSVALVHVAPVPPLMYDMIARATPENRAAARKRTVRRAPEVLDVIGTSVDTYRAFLRGKGFLYIGS
ncbi:restriction endonuclease [Streptomyces edwardsiae]|uniref:Restriction endonuclease n=1 Tax=Streptomyces edwardsiae TaxID=3075527 RepID=A0ABU2PTA7_9ACTN|nr:restriction endonuclease [Streptomyces sp. DSM 41636]MDT0394229.1 restriction endonuclease [Streptomyces sp. DSM 41636]